PDLADEEVSNLERVHEEPVRAVAAAAKARGSPCVAVCRQVRGERRVLGTLVPVGVNHKAAVPARGHLDDVAAALVRAAAAEGPAIAGRDSQQAGASGESEQDCRRERETPPR